MITKHCYKELLKDHQLPEVCRVPLEQLVLRIHAVGMPLRRRSGAAEVCAQLVEPPDRTAVQDSIAELEKIGALLFDVDVGAERLTALGTHLANLPVDARVGKLIMLGIAFGPIAADATLIIAAALG